ncbi:MAG: hypothetical protein Q7R81_07930 [Candidatus Peregrinibacteria bacterium]|nr:hypothetical protein [Candidatus Peregrinibacteria bacterium]
MAKKRSLLQARKFSKVRATRSVKVHRGPSQKKWTKSGMLIRENFGAVLKALSKE